MQLLILSAEAVAALEPSPTLRPRLIASGAETGGHAVNPGVRDDPVHQANWPILRDGRLEEIDPAGAWPAED